MEQDFTQLWKGSGKERSGGKAGGSESLGSPSAGRHIYCQCEAMESLGQSPRRMYLCLVVWLWLSRASSQEAALQAEQERTRLSHTFQHLLSFIASNQNDHRGVAAAFLCPWLTGGHCYYAGCPQIFLCPRLSRWTQFMEGKTFAGQHLANLTCSSNSTLPF